MAREERFIEIQNEISELLDEALSLLNDKEKEIANNHWLARMKSAMFNETQFASQSRYTMDDSIDSFKFTEVEIKFDNCDDSGKFILTYRDLHKNEYDNFCDEKVWFDCENLFQARDLVAELKTTLLQNFKY